MSTYTPAIIIISISLVYLWASTPHLVFGLLLAELFGIGLFMLYASLGAHLDALHLAVGCLFIVCLATSESAIGLSLLISNFVVTGNVHGAPLASTSFSVGTRPHASNISQM